MDREVQVIDTGQEVLDAGEGGAELGDQVGQVGNEPAALLAVVLLLPVMTTALTCSPRRDWLPRHEVATDKAASVVQHARDLALTLGERFGNSRFLIRDHGSGFTRSFDAVFQANGARIL